MVRADQPVAEPVAVAGAAAPAAAADGTPPNAGRGEAGGVASAGGGVGAGIDGGAEAAGAATGVAPWNTGGATAGPHRATCVNDIVSHRENRELSLGRHQWAPVAKKNTCMAIHRVRKNKWATTIPRQRAAISLQIPVTTEATARTAVATPSQNPLTGAGRPPGGVDDGGAGGCGSSAKALSPLKIVTAS